MMRRSSSYNEQLSKRLHNKKYAIGFLESLMEDGLSLEESLKVLIQSMGIKEYSKLSGIEPSNIVEFIKGKRNLKRSTLDKYLKPFGLRTELTLKAA